METRRLAAVAALSLASYAAAATAATATPRQTQYGNPAHTVVTTAVPTTVRPAPAPGALPFTGFEIGGAVLVGAVLVASGLAARRVGARRKA